MTWHASMPGPPLERLGRALRSSPNLQKRLPKHPLKPETFKKEMQGKKACTCFICKSGNGVCMVPTSFQPHLHMAHASALNACIGPIWGQCIAHVNPFQHLLRTGRSCGLAWLGEMIGTPGPHEMQRTAASGSHSTQAP